MSDLQEQTAYQMRFRQFIENYEEPIDLIDFIRYSSTAQSNLLNSDWHDYSDVLYYIDMHDNTDIQQILDTPHSEYYDGEYDNQDPLYLLRGIDEDVFWDLLGGDDCPNYEEMKDLYESFEKKQRLKEARGKIKSAKEAITIAESAYKRLLDMTI